MKTKRVKRDMDLNNPPPLTVQKRASLAVLAKRPDDKIDH